MKRKSYICISEKTAVMKAAIKAAVIMKLKNALQQILMNILNRGKKLTVGGVARDLKDDEQNI